MRLHEVLEQRQTSHLYEEPTLEPSGDARPVTSNKFKDIIDRLTSYVDEGGTVTPKLRAAVKNIWMQMGGVRAESRD